MSVSAYSNGPASGLMPQTSHNPFNTANNRLTSATYDPRGNMTLIAANSVQMSYDGESRQTQTVDPGTGQTANYLYDASGQRVQKQVGGVTTVYVHDVYGQLVAVYNSAGITPVCTTCYLTYDQIGSVRLITDQNASVVGRHDYVPYGEEIFSGTGGRSGNGFGSDATVAQMFTGQARDGGTAVLDYFNARHLSAVLGSFTQPDPGNAGADITRPQSWNAYGYVLGNPLGMVDPSGMLSWGGPPSGPPEDGYQKSLNDYCWPACYSFNEPSGPTGPVLKPVRGGGGGSGGDTSSASPAAAPSPANTGILHILACSVASVTGPLAAAQLTKRVAGIGITGSAGAGLILGGGASLGIQLVADPKGDVGLSLSGSWSGILIGASAMVGVQGTVTNATSIQGLNGPSGGLDFSFGAGPAVDLGVQSGSSLNWKKLVGPLSGSATVGLGAGTRMTALSLGGTKVWSLTNCGTH